MKKLKLPAILATSAALTLVLAACTSPTNDAPKPSADATSEAAPAPATNQCIDGAATLLASEDGTISFPEGCETVYVVASNQTIDLGPTTNLIFEGTGNTVTIDGDLPTIGGTTEGDGNTVTPK